MLTFIKKLLPYYLKNKLKEIRFNCENLHHENQGLICSVCDSGVRRFIPLASIMNGKFIMDVMIGDKPYSVDNYETLSARNFLCPVCGASDRARLYALYLKMKFQDEGKRMKSSKLVHFAPEGGLGECLSRLDYLTYRSADLYRLDVDDCVDLTDMRIYPDASYDIFICSHVLEHIPDDFAAIKELFRVLKFGGWGIIMVPIMLGLEATYEDASVDTEEGRLKHFGLEDHLRVYSKADFIGKLKAQGFNVLEITHSDFSVGLLERHGIEKNSVLYVVEKKEMAA